MNGQSRDRGNTGHMTQNEDITQKTNEKMSNADIVKNPGMNTGTVEGYAVHVTYKTHRQKTRE